MNNLKTAWYWVFLALGVVLVAVCGFALKGMIPKSVGGVCIGAGSALAALCANKLFMGRMLKKNPEMQRKMRIDEKDERNVAINNRAKAKAFNAITPVFAIVMLATILMGVDLAVTLVLVGGYVVVNVVYFVFLSKYNKEM